MGKSDITIREDEMWCPECGAPIKKGFFTCSNCNLKVRMTQDINKDQGKKSRKKPKKKPSKQVKKEEVPAKEDEPVKEKIEEEVSSEKKEDAQIKEGDIFPAGKPIENSDKNPVNKEGHPRYWNF